MKKRELLARIEQLEARILLLEAQRYTPIPMQPLQPFEWSGTPLPPLPIVTC